MDKKQINHVSLAFLTKSPPTSETPFILRNICKVLTGSEAEPEVEEERVVAHLPQPLLFMPIPLIAGIEVTCLQDYLLAGWS